MLLASYSAPRRHALAVLPFVLFFITLLLSWHDHYSTRINSCYIYRQFEKPARTWIPIRDSALHNYSVYVMWTAMLILALLPNDRIAGLYALLFSSIWFHITYVLLAALKSRMDDFNCAGRHDTYPNGISGHYCYFLYVSLTIPLLARPRIAANRNAPPIIFAIVTALLGVYAVGAAATLYRTFMHGYHSIRQIFLGSALGLAAHLFLEFFQSKAMSPSVGSQLAMLVSNSILVFTLYYTWWPTQQAGPAISIGQVFFHLALYLALCASAVLLSEKERKRGN